MTNISSTDALADVLKTIRLSASAYFCEDFTSPWGMDVARGEQGVFHVVIKGSCLLQVATEQVLELEQGDIVAFPRGAAHWISDQQKSVRMPVTEVVEKVLSGENPFNSVVESSRLDITLLCGAFDYDSSIDHPFVKELPEFIHIRAADTPSLDWLRTIVMVLSSESRVPSPGSTVMVDRITELLFIQLIRFHMASQNRDMGYMAALADRQIGQALNLIHGESKACLSVESLADAVALSRTAFSEKFSKMVGLSAKRYLLDWRMQRAKVNLAQNKMSTQLVAEFAGYSSEAAFSKAFKQFFNISPGQAKKL